MAETAGSLIDKITIVQLKIYHMREQTDRRDISSEFRAQCERRLDVLREQGDDLAGELTQLIQDLLRGRVVPKVYRQYKMYNDPMYRRPSQDGRG